MTIRTLLMISVFLGLFLSVSFDAQMQEQSNSGEHPRLFFSADDIPAMREAAETTHSALWEPVRAYVDNIINEPRPTTIPDNVELNFFREQSDRLLPLALACVLAPDLYCDPAREHLMAVASWSRWDVDGRRDLGLAHVLMGVSIAYDWLHPVLSEEEREQVRNYLMQRGEAMYDASSGSYQNEWSNWWTTSYAQNHYWSNNSALGLAGLVLMTDVDIELEPSALPDCVVRSRNAINLRQGPSTNDPVMRILQPGQELIVAAQITGDDGFVWWYTTEGLWVRSDVVSIEGDCDQVPMYVDTSPQTWVEHAAERIERVSYLLNGIEDGSWHEGIRYQSYGMAMTLPFMVNLRRLHDIDLLPHDYLRNYPYWHVYNSLPNSIESVMAYGNFEWWWGNSYSPQHVIRFTAQEYGNPYAQWMADHFNQAAANDTYNIPWRTFDFLYYDADLSPQSPDDLEGARVFPDLEGVIWRTGWGEDDLAFGLNTGAYGGRYIYETFSNADYPWGECNSSNCVPNTGHNHADANTFYLLRGSTWLLPEHEGAGRSATQYHNTILIDGQGQFRPAEGTRPEAYRGSDGELLDAVNMPGVNYIAADAARRYRSTPDLETFTRHIVFVRADEGERRAVDNGDGYFIMLDQLASQNAHMYTWISHFGGPAELDGEWVRSEAEDGNVIGVGIGRPDPFDVTISNENRPYIHLRPTETTASMRFITMLYPTDSAGWDARPEFTVRADTGRAAVIRVQHVDGRYDDVLFGYDQPDDIFHVTGDYAFDMQIAVISYDQNGDVTHTFGYGGTFVSKQPDGDTFLSNLRHSQAVVTVYNDDEILITGDFMQEIMIYAPHAERLIVNGEPTTFRRDGLYIIIEPG